MNIKLIALDLDGTTLQNDHTISPRVRRALEKAIEKYNGRDRRYGGVKEE